MEFFLWALLTLSTFLSFSPTSLLFLEFLHVYLVLVQYIATVTLLHILYFLHTSFASMFVPYIRCHHRACSSLKRILSKGNDWVRWMSTVSSQGVAFWLTNTSMRVTRKPKHRRILVYEYTCTPSDQENGQCIVKLKYERHGLKTTCKNIFR